MKQPIHDLLEEKFGIRDITDPKELDQLIKILRENGEQEIELKNK